QIASKLVIEHVLESISHLAFKLDPMPRWHNTTHGNYCCLSQKGRPAASFNWSIFPRGGEAIASFANGSGAMIRRGRDEFPLPGRSLSRTRWPIRGRNRFDFSRRGRKMPVR
ncbi:hypothetical protein ACFL34_02665, partial [Candidatus Sumerlaeota bacterium]